MDREGQAKNFLEWRFSGGMDREGQAKNFLELTEEEDKLIGEKPGQVDKLCGRRKGKKGPVYECGPALMKLMMQVDERIAFEASGIATKKLTQLNIQKHLDNFNLETQFGTYSKIP